MVSLNTADDGGSGKSMALLTAAIGQLNTSISRNSTELGSLHEGMREGNSILAVLFGYVKELVSFGPTMDKVAAKFSSSMEGNKEETQKLAKIFDRKGIPASVWDALSFNLHTNSLALDSTSEGLRDLFGMQLATGENYTDLAKKLGSATVGTKDQKRSLNKLTVSLEDTARSTNLSRTDLIGALSKLSSNTLNLMATTAGQSVALQGAMMVLKGRIGDERLFGDLSTLVNRMLTPEGIFGARAMGFDVDALIDGNLTQNEILENLTALFDQMASYQRSTGVGALMLLSNLKGTLGDISTATAVRNKLAQNSLKMQEEVNEGFQKTWTMLMKEIFNPLINSFEQLFYDLKALLGDDFGKLMQITLFGIGKVVIGLTGVIIKLVSWLSKALIPDESLFALMKEGMDDTQAILRRMEKSGEETSKNTKTTAQIQRDRRAEETNIKLSDALKSQTKFSIHQTKAFPVLLKKLIEEAKEGNRIARAGIAPVVVVQSEAGETSPIHFA